MSKQAENQFKLIQKALAVILHNPNAAVKKRIFDDNKFPKKDYAIFAKQAFVRPWNKGSVIGFNNGDPFVTIPLELITDPDSKLLDLIKCVYPVEQFKWTEELIDNLAASFGSYLSDEDVGILQKDQPKVFQRLAAVEALYLDIYTRAEEPRDKKSRTLFFAKTVQDVKIASFYGVANCGLMTDLAFLEALYLNFDCTINYIRFLNDKNPKIEECNSIALGNWPDPGCMIINPWHGPKGKCYVWNGAFENTPEATELLKSHNAVKVIFRSLPNSEERNDFREHLIADGYNCWIRSNRRLDRHHLIKEHCKNFKLSLIQHGFIQQKTEDLKHSFNLG